MLSNNRTRNANIMVNGVDYAGTDRDEASYIVHVFKYVTKRCNATNSTFGVRRLRPIRVSKRPRYTGLQQYFFLMHRIHSTNLVFIHIPKTAGQALKAAFEIENETPGSHGVNTAFDRTLLGSEYIRFCVVRHPFDRFVSSFKYNVAEGIRTPNKVKSLAYLMGSKGLASDVNDFVDWLYSQRFDLMKYAHLQSQSYYVRMGNPQIIMRHEMIATDCEIVRRLAPQAWRGLPVKNASRDKAGIEGLQTNLSERSRLQLAQMYCEDFDRFGYRPDETITTHRADRQATAHHG